MDEAMHVIKESMNDTGGVGYFHVRLLTCTPLSFHFVHLSFSFNSFIVSIHLHPLPAFEKEK